MYKGKRVAVVVPAYNESEFITQTIETIPYFVDRIYAVSAASTDNTLDIISRFARKNGKLSIVNCKRRAGVGAAIVSGHKKVLKENIDVVAVMAGDGQMDPAILHKILDPVVEDKADYAKGDRLSIPQHRRGMPAWRVFGNLLLTYLTRIASGYHHICDPQNGYTAMSTKILRKLDLDRLEKDYAFENDLLVKLNMVGSQSCRYPSFSCVSRGEI